MFAAVTFLSDPMTADWGADGRLAGPELGIAPVSHDGNMPLQRGTSRSTRSGVDQAGKSR